MKTIHKYKLPTEPIGEYWIRMPKNSLILKIGWQRNREAFNETNLCLWALVNESAPLTETEFFITTTGADLNPAFDMLYTYVDSVMNNDGQYILHVFIGTGVK